MPQKVIAFTILVLVMFFHIPCSWAMGPGAPAGSAIDPGNLVVPKADRMAAENEIRRVEFTSAGIRFVSRAATGTDSIDAFEYSLKTVGRGTATVFVAGQPEAQPVNHANAVYYNQSGAVLEKYEATDSGVDQLIILHHNFGSEGDLEISGETATSLRWEESPVMTLGALTLYSSMEAALRYGPVVVTDAGGRRAKVEIHLEGTRLTLVVPEDWARDATYPVTIRSSIRAVSAAPTLTTGLIGKRGPTASDEPMVSSATTETSVGNTPVFRAQFRIRFYNITDSTYFNFFEVKLNPNNSTWIYPNPKMIPGYYYNYDLVLDNVTNLSDITMLWLSKFGQGNWYISSIGLYVNGEPVYSRYFSEELLSLTGNDIHIVPAPELWTHSSWLSYAFPGPPRLISDRELEDRVESILGDYLMQQRWEGGWNPASLMWGYYPISVLGGESARQVHFSVELRYDSYRVGVGFNLEFNCSNGKIFVATRNLGMSYPVVNNASMANKLMLQTFVQLSLPMIIQRDLQKVTYTNALGYAVCPIIEVDEWGSVTLKY